MANLDKKNIHNILSLTSLQEGILFHYLKDKKENLYFVQLSLEINGAIINDYFQEAWNKVIENNEMLRTVFRWEKLSKPVQIILKEQNVDIRYYDLLKEENATAENEFQKIKLKDHEEGFDLKKVPFRLTLCKFKRNKYYLLISNHHIIYDGWSNGIILKEFLNYYQQQVIGSNLQIHKKTSFNEYVKLNKKLTNEGVAFWKDYLKTYEIHSVFNSKHNNILKDKANECYKYVIIEEKVQLLKRHCELHRLTIADILYTAWGILLSKYSGNDDILFGTTVSGRNIKLDGIEKIVGLFINTIPLRLYLSKETPLIEIIKENSIHIRERGCFENVPLREILNYSGYKSDELFESIFVIENYPLNKNNLQQVDNLTIRSFDIKESTNYKLTVSAFLNDEIEISFNFSSSDFERYLIESIVKHYFRIIDWIINNNTLNIGSLELLSGEEKHQLLYEFNCTEAIYPKEKTIRDLFENQVLNTPDSIAIVYEKEFLTYSELNCRSNQLARYLMQKDILQHDLIGVLYEPSLEVYISILGILKTGKAYLPIDTSLPHSRIQFMLNDCGIKILLNGNHRNQYFDDENNPIVPVKVSEIRVDDKSNLNLKIPSSALAYIIYTSGSTGKPKGVLIANSSLVNLCYSHNNFYEIKQEDRISKFAGFGFDASVWEIFPSLIAGSSLYIIPEFVKQDTEEINKYFEKKNITFSFLPTQFCEKFMELDNKSLRILLTGGDKLNYFEKREYKLYNNYGPTENTVVTTRFEVRHLENNIPIGNPIENSSVFILDRFNHIQPIGIPGELCISGAGLAIGYLNNPELTSEKFIKHPFKEAECLYKTGDLACWKPDGTIEFLGRIDHQVKIRGFRIELGEIESNIKQFPLIQECVVLSRDDKSGDKYLCAYVVFKREDEDIVPSLRSFLANLMPDYMIPSYFVELDKIPLTVSGKVDRNSLPEPEIKAGANYIGSANLMESKLVKIWSEILNVAEKEISTNVNFYDLGGHSLKMMILVSRIHKELEVQLELSDIYKSQTIQKQAKLISLTNNTIYHSIPKAKSKEYYSLSSSQRRLYLLQQMDLSSVAYNIPGLIKVSKGKTKKQILGLFNVLIDRHESLRTSFEVIGEEPVQHIHSEVSLNISEYSIKREELSKLKEDFVQSFDLSHAPLLRMAYINIQNGDNLLLIDMHHIISDGRSHEVLSYEFNRLLSGENLPPLLLQYKDYSEWYNSKEQQTKIKSQERYWLSQFEGEVPVMSLPADYLRPVMQSSQGANVNFNFSKEETDNIKELANTYGLTFYMSALAVFTILLSKLSGEEDIVFGTPVSGRNHADLENVVGMFVNTLAIRNKVLGNSGIEEYITLLKQKTLNAYSNQDYQFEDLVDKVVVERDTSRNPLFDVMFNWIGQDAVNSGLVDFNTPIYEHIVGISKFDLTLTITDLGDNFQGNFEYCTDLFSPDTIEKFIGYYKNIIHQLRNDVKANLSSIEILSKKEKERLLFEFNQTKSAYPQNTIQELFEQQVQKSPASIAVEDGKNFITYEELNQYANKLSGILHEKGVGKGDVVPVIMECSSHVIIAILGILKSGAAFLPIDSLLLPSRISYILNNSKSKNIITKYIYKEELNLVDDVILIDKLDFNKGSIKNPEIKCGHEDIAYIIYTSGTTGNPKGTVLKNGGLVNYIYWASRKYIKNGQGNFPLFTSISFDLTITSIFTPLISGNKIVIYHSEEKEALIEKIIDDNRVNIIKLTPSHLQLIREKQFSSEELLKLNLTGFIVGGENLDTGLAEDIYDNFAGKITIYNEYGPTEATVGCMISEFDKKETSRLSVSIGIPVSNMKIYILDKYLKLVPKGVHGEIYISGVGLSIGYLGSEKLTKSKFIPNPYEKGERLYKTGDIALMLNNGKVEFVGRTDSQVKIRGFRIELGEVERSILKYSKIKECAVLAKENKGDKFLCAYIVSKNKIEQSDLRAFLLEFLPEYMIPSFFMVLEKMPITSNGKINRKLLPNPEYKAGEDYIAPTIALETKLVSIWADILKIQKEEISVTANFFTLGGHSLKASILTGRIHKEIGVEIPLRDIFLFPTVQSQAKQIGKSKAHEFVSIPKAQIHDFYELSAAQRRLFLLQHMELDSKAYNMPCTIVLSNDTSIDQIQDVFDKLIERHESFRTSFDLEGDNPVQRIHSGISLKIEKFRIKKTEKKRFQEKFIQAFDLSIAPLMRVSVVDVEGELNLLLIDMHHIISDGVSNSILEKEFNDLLEGKNLSPLNLQYKDYSEWQNSEEQQQAMVVKEEYWLKLYEGNIPIINLPTDYSRPAVQNYDGALVNFYLSKEEIEQLNYLAKDCGLTLYMSVFTVFSILISKLSGQEDIIIGTPVSGRNHTDLENIVGMFVNTLALRIDVQGEWTIIEFAKKFKLFLLEAFENQNYQFEDLVEKVTVSRDTSRNPLFDVMFDLINQPHNLTGNPDLNKEEYSHNPGMSKFDLSLSVVNYGEQILCTFEYCTKLFKPETIDRIISYFKQILKQLKNGQNQNILALEIVSEKEKRQLLFEFNNTKRDYSKGKTISQLFEDQVEHCSDKIAISYFDTQLTYSELNTRANRLAYTLRKYGVKPNYIVGLYGDRTPHMIISLVAVLKAGGGFLPIASSTVVNRCEKILKESGTKLLLTQKSLIDEVKFSGKVIDVEDEINYSDNYLNLENVNSFNDAAYVIYTSGSSGTPKGVMVAHKNYSNVHFAWREIYNLTQKDTTLLQLASFGFDVFAGDIARSLLNGAKIVICPDEIRLDFKRLSSLLLINRVNIFESTPGLTIPFLDYAYKNGEFFKDLNFIIIGSDSFSARDYIKIQSLFGKNKRIINSYGVTEATIDTSFYEENYNIPKEDNLPIGKPMPNMSFFILNSYNKLQPIGVPGELCIGGEGVALGYLNNPILTAEKFILHPFETGKIIYRTGDLARWLPDGNVEFLGRIDNQVKIRGFRIELGEIENQVLNIDKISKAIVIDREDDYGHKNLWCYIVEKQNIEIDELRSILNKTLPEYMIPAFFVKLDKIPLTANGKIDKKALFNENAEIENDYIAPKNEIEKLIIEVWKSILGDRKIGINQNFFQVGGNSIKSIQISSRLHNLGYKVSVMDIYSNPTVQGLAKILMTSTDKIKHEFSISPIQKRYFTNNEKNISNQVRTLVFSNRISKKHIQAIFLKLINNHDGLRLNIRSNDKGKIQQYIVDQILDIDIIEKKCNEQNDLNLNLSNLEEELRIKVDIKDNPIELAILHSKDYSYLVIAAHYLLFDEYSWTILIDDISELYSKLQSNIEIGFSTRKESIIDWINDFEDYKGSDRFKDTRKFWDNYFSINKKNYQKKEKANNNSLAEIEHIAFSFDYNQGLLNKANKAFNTKTKDLLLTTLLLCLKDELNCLKLAVDLTTDARQELNYSKKINKSIGRFTSIYSQIINLNNLDEESISIIKCVKDTIKRVPNYGFDYLAYKYADSNEQSDYEISDTIPIISFEYLETENQNKQKYPFKVLNSKLNTNIIPENNLGYLINVVASYQHNVLSLDLYFNKTRLQKQAIQRIGKGFINIFESISNDCIKRKVSEKTPSDYTYKLSDDEFVFLKSQYNFTDVYPLSPLQEGMYFHYLLNPDTSTFLPQVRFRLTGHLNINVLKDCLNQLMKRYEILRTIFINKGFLKPLQVVLDHSEMPFIFKDIRDEYKNGEIEVVLNKYGDIDKNTVFNLNKDILIRVTLLQLNDNEFEFIYTHHHILIDGWCLGILTSEFFELYNKQIGLRTKEFPPVQQYVNYINWLSGKNQIKTKTYWKDYLKEYNLQSTIPIEKNQNNESYELRIVELIIDQQVVAKCTQFIRELGVTMNTLFSGVWGLVLSFYNNTNDVVFGSVVSGRSSEIEGVETMLGLFMNTVPVRVQYDENAKVKNLLTDLHNNIGKSESHHYYSLAEIQNNTELKKDLFDHYIAFQNIPTDEIEYLNIENVLHNLKISDIRDVAHTNYNFGLNIIPGDNIVIEFKFNSFVYDQKDIEMISNHFNRILNEIILDSEKSINKIKQDLILEFNNEIKKIQVEKEEDLQNKLITATSRTSSDRESLDNWDKLF